MARREPDGLEDAVAPRRKNPQDLFPGFAEVVEIGGGSLGVVFRARDIASRRLVALKLLDVSAAAPKDIESFERESVELGALSAHPNIVTVLRVFKTPDGSPVLVLELCSGELAGRLRDGGRLPVPDAVAIGIKIASALETAHRGGILHRDITPRNILFTEFGEPALSDFCVSLVQAASRTTGLFEFITPHAAPELLEGGAASPATDVYELASSLYQLIAGQSPFRGFEGESPASIILRILSDPVPPLSSPDVPTRLSDLLLRAMSKDKDERPRSAAEFAAELALVEIEQSWVSTRFLISDASGAGSGRPGAPRHAAAQDEPDPADSPEWPVSAEADRYPIPPTAAAPKPPAVTAGAVPIWATRAAANDVAIGAEHVVDPATLPARLTVQAGRYRLAADEYQLTLRSILHTEHLPWSQISGFELQFEDGEPGPEAVGMLVALTPSGAVELPATKRAGAQLRALHAQLSAYRVRAADSHPND